MAGTRYIDFDNLRQSAMLLDDPWELRLRYTRFLALALAFQPEPKRVLILGLGGGSFPKRLHRDFPQVVVDVVDIDPEVIGIAKRYFQVPEDSRLRLHLRDGRRFVRETTEKYDLIFLDAYNSDTIPFHLTTREFYRQLEAHLAPGGFVVSNIIGALRGPQSAFFRAMYRTLADTFPTVYVVPTYDGGGAFVLGEINILLFATRDSDSPDPGGVHGAGRPGWREARPGLGPDGVRLASLRTAHPGVRRPHPDGRLRAGGDPAGLLASIRSKPQTAIPPSAGQEHPGRNA